MGVCRRSIFWRGYYFYLFFAHQHKAAGVKTKQKQRLRRLLIRCSLCWGRKKFSDRFSRFDTIPECDSQPASHPASHVAVAITLNAKASSLKREFFTERATELAKKIRICLSQSAQKFVNHTKKTKKTKKLGRRTPPPQTRRVCVKTVDKRISYNQYIHYTWATRIGLLYRQTSLYKHRYTGTFLIGFPFSVSFFLMHFGFPFSISLFSVSLFSFPFYPRPGQNPRYEAIFSI